MNDKNAEKPGSSKAAKATSPDRKQRSGEALRANLHRRKAQARARAGSGDEAARKEP